jgi:hypothetical protein
MQSNGNKIQRKTKALVTSSDTPTDTDDDNAMTDLVHRLLPKHAHERQLIADDDMTRAL